MILNFQRRFALPVWQGIKTQTIRAAGRAHHPAVGDIAHCYTGLRTRNTQLLGRWSLLKVDAIRMSITHAGLEDVVVGGGLLNYAGVMELALRDGFDDATTMHRWFVDFHGSGDFDGHVYQWKYEQSLRAPHPPSWITP